MTTQAPDILDNPIQKIVTESGLSRGLGDDLVQAFGPPFAEASNLIAASRQIVVTDATQVTEMRAARTARLKLREIRTAAEKRRKEMKEDSLRMGKAIDNVAKTIAMLTEPEEARLEEAEKFAERAEAARKASLRSSREELLRPFNIDTSYYDLGSMPDVTFAGLLESTRIAHEAKIAAAKKAEDDRIAETKAKAEEDARIRAENERLRQERADQAARHAKKQAEAEAKLRAEREAREKLEREQREREQAEAKKKAAEARAAKKAAMAPDADKLRALARDLSAVKRPQMATEEGEAALQNLLAMVSQVVVRIRESAEALS